MAKSDPIMNSNHSTDYENIVTVYVHDSVAPNTKR